jgi:hypothetical protein
MVLPTFLFIMRPAKEAVATILMPNMSTGGYRDVLARIGNWDVQYSAI